MPRSARIAIVSSLFIAALAFIGWRMWDGPPPAPVCSGEEASGLKVVLRGDGPREAWLPSRCAEMGGIATSSLAWWAAEHPDRVDYLRKAWRGRLVEIYDEPRMAPGYEKGANGILTPLDLSVELAWHDPAGKVLAWPVVLSTLGHELGHLGASYTLTQEDLAEAVQWARTRQAECRARAPDAEAAAKCKGPDRNPEHDWFSMRGYAW